MDLNDARREFVESITKTHHEQMIENPSPNTWQHFPILPLNHRFEREGPFPAPGLLHASNVLHVLRANLYAVLDGEFTPEELQERVVIYNSIQDILKDWQVD